MLDEDTGFDFSDEPDDPVLAELFNRLHETRSPTATLDHLALNVLDADIEEYAEARNASKQRIRWNAK